MSDTPDWPQLIASLLAGRDLRVAEATWAMERIVTGEVASPTLAGFLVALRAKGETVDEIVGFRDAILANARPLPLPVAGAGHRGHRRRRVQDGEHLYDRRAGRRGAGVPVAKHGNRAAAPHPGQRRARRARGVALDLDGDALRTRLPRRRASRSCRLSPSIRGSGSPRRPGSALGRADRVQLPRPAGAPRLRPDVNVIGVAAASQVPLITGVLQTRGATALVVRSDDGMDELSTTGHTRIREVSSGAVKARRAPRLCRAAGGAHRSSCAGGTPQENAATIRRVLAGEGGPVRDIVLLNAAAGLVAWDLYEDPSNAGRPIASRLSDAVERAARVVDSGAATVKLDAWVAATHSTPQG